MLVSWPGADADDPEPFPEQEVETAKMRNVTTTANTTDISLSSKQAKLKRINRLGTSFTHNKCINVYISNASINFLFLFEIVTTTTTTRATPNSGS